MCQMEFNPKTSENCIYLIQFKPDCPAVYLDHIKQKEVHKYDKL